jgi:hypothetical protein
MNVGVRIYKTEKLTFILDGEKVIIRTTLNQAFYLSPKAHYWRRRLKLIQTMIELNEVRNLEELASWCAAGQIEWVSTTRKYELANESMVV